MKELTRVFDEVEIPVEYVDENNIWFDVSNINSKFKVRFTEWKESKRVKETLKLIEKTISLKRPLIDDEVYGKNFIHKKMFVNFARFVSIEFEIKADEIITGILLGEKKLCDDRYAQVKQQLQISQQNTREAKRKAYAFVRDGDKQLISRIIKDFGIDITANELNELLYMDSLVDRIPKSGYDYYHLQPSFVGEEDVKVAPLFEPSMIIKFCREHNIEVGVSANIQPSLFSEV